MSDILCFKIQCEFSSMWIFVSWSLLILLIGRVHTAMKAQLKRPACFHIHLRLSCPQQTIILYESYNRRSMKVNNQLSFNTFIKLKLPLVPYFHLLRIVSSCSEHVFVPMGNKFVLRGPLKHMVLLVNLYFNFSRVNPPATIDLKSHWLYTVFVCLW